MNKVVKYFILLLLISNCTSKNDDKNEKVPFPISVRLSDCFRQPTKMLLSLSDIADSISYIQLETSGESIVGNVTSIKQVSDGFLINDRTKSLLKFDKEGRFIWKLSKQGRGPLEYEILNPDFCIDERLKEIYLPDRKNIFIYDYNGQPKEVIKLPFYVDKIFFLKTGFYLVSNSNPNEQFLASVIDHRGLIIKQFQNNNIQQKVNYFGRLSNTSGSQIISDKDKILLSNLDTIWELDEELCLNIKYVIDRRIENSEDQVYSYSLNVLNDSLLIFSIIYKADHYLFDIRSKLYYELKDGTINDDMDSGPDVAIWKAKGGMIIEALPASEFLKVDITKVKEESKLFKILTGININDNPVIRIIKLKE